MGGSPTGHHTPYLYAELVRRTGLAVNEVFRALDPSLTPEEYRSGKSCQIRAAKVFRSLLVPDDKRCTLLADMPIHMHGDSAADPCSKMAEDLRLTDKLVSDALGADGASVLDLELIGCQATLPYG